MKRLVKAYISIAAILILGANAVLIFIYGRQFLYEASADCPSCVDQSVTWSVFIITNAVILGLLILIWFLGRYIISQHASANELGR